jgi:serine/threonine-protein kinase
MTARTSAEAMLPRAGDLVLGRYRIEQVVGRGGMGIVFSARHELLGQRVALKVLLPEAQDDEARKRFLNEARASVRIKSQHVVNVMDVGTLETGLPFIMMELLEGRDLGRLLKQAGPFPIAKAIDYCMQALEALAAAHALQIVHRDLKPSNLFVAALPNGGETLKVLDFGISKTIAGGTPDMAQTSTRALLGSPLYVSPEQLRSSRTVDTRADIWALGIILYELLTGQTPFERDSFGEVFVAIIEQPIEPVRVRRPDVPADLERIIFHCLERDRDRRFPDVASVARALAPFGTMIAQTELPAIEANVARGVPPPEPTLPGGLAAPDERPALLGQTTPMPPLTPPPMQQTPQPKLAQSATSAPRAWIAAGGVDAPPSVRPHRNVALIVLGLAGALMFVAAALITRALVTSHPPSVAEADAASSAAATAPGEPPPPPDTSVAAAVPPPTGPVPPPTSTHAPPPPPTTRPAGSTRPPTPATTSTSILDKRR